MILSTSGMALSGLYATDEVVAEVLPVDLATDTWRTMLRVIAPAAAGDVLDVSGRARVSSRLPYTVGVGWHLWVYDLDDQGSSGPWWKISPSCGDNVNYDRHHMPLHITGVWTVPAEWPAGHRAVVVLRADAHSTAWQPGDTITVDQAYGLLAVRRWTP